jgi:hypothetical protein
MLKFDEIDVKERFESNLEEAKDSLAKLQFCRCGRPSFRGLSGWVFEQTIHGCLLEELKLLNNPAEIEEQVGLGGRVTADLFVGKAVAIEVKAKGLFSGDAETRYGKCKTAAEGLGYFYLYLTLEENYRRYRESICAAVGCENAFFLDTSGDWMRFIERVVQLLKNHEQQDRPQG